jgi:acetoacetyl-CoA synthetase
MPLFVVLEDGLELDAETVSLIRARIRDRASARHVPDEVIAAPGIPHTRTGKKLEVPVKRLLKGHPLDDVVNLATVDRPELLAFYAEFARSASR